MRIGILGAGQLAQLISHAAYQLGMEVICYAESEQQPAAINSKIFVGELDDQQRLADFCQQVDLVTLENENIEIATLATLNKTLHPAKEAIAITQDRLLEKQFFTQLKIATPAYYAINHLEDLQTAMQQHTTGLLKTRRFGYDGKGQVKLDQQTDLKAAWQTIKQQPAIFESFIDFDYEVSLIAARNTVGEIQFYPLINNTHHAGILRLSKLCTVNTQLQQQAEAYLHGILTTLNYVGVLAVEFFVKDNQLLANEMAPRVHNSGHLTIEATNCSQFESHLRAICGLSLPAIEIKQPTAMLNLIGELPDKTAVLQQYSNLHFYDYGKSARPKRKLGHLTLTATNQQQLDSAVNKLLPLIQQQ